MQILIRHCLIYLASEKDESLKRSLEKLFCVSLEAMRDDEEWIEKVESELETNEEFYEKTLRNIQEEIERFRLEEEQYQLRLMNRLREEVCEMDPIELLNAIRLAIQRRIEEENNAWRPNNATIQALAKLFFCFSMRDPLAIEVLAEALGVNPDHFKNAFFASVEHEGPNLAWINSAALGSRCDAVFR